MPDVVARKNAMWMVVFVTPDVCLTPMGSAQVPVPYPATAMLSTASSTSGNVFANQDAVVIYDQTKVPTTIGDVAGVGKGVCSGTVGAKCWPKSHSKQVWVNKKQVVRHDDEFWMNGNG